MTTQRTNALLLVLLLGLSATAQQLDSLLAVWRDPQRSDSLRVDAYKDYIFEGFIFSDPDSAFQLADSLVAFGRERGYARAMAAGYNLQGIAFYVKGQPAKAIGYYQQCYAIHERVGNERGMGGVLGNIGVIYGEQGDRPKAIDHYQRSLLLCERSGNRSCVASALANLGIVYLAQSRHEKALEYYERALAIHEELGNERGMANSFLDIGGLYARLKQPDKALEQYQRALSMLEALNDKQGMAIALDGIGLTFGEQGKYDSALPHLQRSLALSTEIGDPKARSSVLTSIGQVYAALGDHRKALIHCDQGEQVARDATLLSLAHKACVCLYESHKALGQDGEALKYIERLRALDDSLQAEETALKLEQMEFAQQLFADSVARAEEARLVEEAHREEIRTKNRTRNYMAVGGLVLLLVAVGLYGRSRYMRRSRDLISRERDRSENLLLNILPAEVAAELKEKGRSEAREYAQVSILFTDFKGFTEASARLSAGELVNEINTCFEAFDRIIERYGVEKIKTIGDAYMAAGGLPVPTADAAQRTVLAALDMQDFITRRHAERAAQGLPAFEMRVGIHTGPVVAGIVGVKKFQYDIWGDTVNTASRMESSGEVGRVNISEATYALVKDTVVAEDGVASTHRVDLDNDDVTVQRKRHVFTFTPRGKVQAKGKGEMEMYFVSRSAEGA